MYSHMRDASQTPPCMHMIFECPDFHVEKIFCVALSRSADYAPICVAAGSMFRCSVRLEDAQNRPCRPLIVCIRSLLSNASIGDVTGMAHLISPCWLEEV